VSRLRSAVRRYIPREMRQHLAHVRRTLRDRFGSARYRIVDGRAASRATDAFAPVLSVEQAIRHTAHSSGKIANLRIAAARLSRLIVAQDQVLSFWALVGAPSEANGFKVGRSLVADHVAANIGGGLCQISGLLYELGLRAGLSIVERHAHSRDLYTEETRFTPIGLDATVVWGFKDVRLRNTGRTPVAFDFEVGDGRIIGRVLAPRRFELPAIRVVRTELGPRTRAARVYRVMSGSPEQMVSDDVYVIDAN
jgi:vancomycin resistance protein VanW